MEKFAGALFTTSVEAFVPATGKGVQVIMQTNFMLTRPLWRIAHDISCFPSRPDELSLSALPHIQCDTQG